ncbi:NAD-dependent epimerase/dehydratase family protein [Alkaliphilus peptidifermentans]|uniref:Nucleoside-diphosphate-sugar epimerase n=1 Tax=Alkaliphilus peptidifermentans DSM 18978 TaxID=1120976 RepID=A0A1G5AGK0_9FIRM|nr:NAD-dependent epimerase/dehydratase family protein [Alkaliphilus peptidifermentans]SCX76991.1 Nucleoside-diphosphate-sugar epimerase [Alkaliphilus peptidifermentans DSM 18978]
MKKAIVTGGTGFVGSNLCKFLIKNDWEVSVITRPSSDYSNISSVLNEIDVFEYDGQIERLIDYFNEKNVEIVFHLASLFIAEHESNQIDGLVDSNIKFGLHILEAMKESKTKLLINSGTSWQHYHSDEYNPVDLYAATKQAFESLVKYYVEAENIRVITLKLFDTYGEFDKRPKLINLLHKFADENKELNMSPGEQVLDLVHVNDVVKAYVKAYEYLVEQGIGFQEFGVGSKKPIRLKDLINKFEFITGKKLNVIWGGRNYRKREVMKLWGKYETLPGWIIEVSLEEGLLKYNGNKNN